MYMKVWRTRTPSSSPGGPPSPSDTPSSRVVPCDGGSSRKVSGWWMVVVETSRQIDSNFPSLLELKGENIILGNIAKVLLKDINSLGNIFFVRISLASRAALGITFFVCLTHCFSKLRVVSKILPSGGKIGFGIQRRRCFRPVTFTEKMSSFKVRCGLWMTYHSK